MIPITATLTRPTWIAMTPTRKTLNPTLTMTTTQTTPTASTLMLTLITPTGTMMTRTGIVRQHQLHYPNTVSGNTSLVDRHDTSKHVGVLDVLGNSGRSDSSIPVIASGMLIMPVGTSLTAVTSILEVPKRLTLSGGTDRSSNCSNFIVPGIEVFTNGGLAPTYLSHLTPWSWSPEWACWPLWPAYAFDFEATSIRSMLVIECCRRTASHTRRAGVGLDDDARLVYSEYTDLRLCTTLWSTVAHRQAGADR